MTNRHCPGIFVAGAAIALLLIVAPLARAAAPKARPADPLEGYGKLVAAALEEWNVPGAAVAVVRDGKLVFAQGFGVRESGRPGAVDLDTIFPIASLSKGFTAATIGLLAESKTLGWDEPLSAALPGLRFSDPQLTRELSFRDALSHRTALSESADLLWSVADLDRAAIIDRLRFVPVDGTFRLTESYRNVVVVAAAEAAAHRAGERFDDLVRDRILSPAALTRTSVGAPAAGEENVSSLHSDATGKVRVVPAEPTLALAPAAGLYSTARDLVRWLSLFLGRGTLDGRRILAESTVDELLSPWMLQPISNFQRTQFPESHFLTWGLGWVLQDYRGRLVAWNTGGLTGASCTVAMIPEEKLGVVVLTNGGRTGLPEALAWSALDRLLGAPAKDWNRIRRDRSLAARERQRKAESELAAARVAETRPTLPPEAYAGKWTQDLVGEASITLDARGGSLRIGKGPLARLEHWHYDTWMARWPEPDWGVSRVTFQLGADGNPQRMVVEDVGEFRRAE